MKNILILSILLLSLSPSLAQQTQTWEELWQELQGDDDADEGEQDDAYERLAQIARHPLDINRVTREELEQLPFLSELQVMDLLEYRHRYGPVRSVRELKMVASLDIRQLELLPFFVYADGSSQHGDSIVGTRHRRLNPKMEVTFTGRVPFQERKGDREGYLGYRYRHSLRAEYSEGERLRAGLIGSQDAGEPFFANENKWGYDSYSYYVQVGRYGVLDRAVVGKYRVSAGMGLVLGSSFTLSKLASLSSLGRQPVTLRPHTSRSQADYFRGAAATVGLLRRDAYGDAPLKITAFASYRPIDATLSADGTATTLTTDGYHRTVAEMEKKDNTHLTAFGGRVAYNRNGWRAGVNIVSTYIDRDLRTSSALYHRYSPSGTDFLNFSLDYGYTRPHLTISGETAMNREGAVATVNSLGWQPSPSFSIMALWRYYGMRYTGLYSHSFGNNSSAQNEDGFFLGTTFKPLRQLTVTAYADYAWFPWAKYLVSQSSRAYDFLAQAEYRLGKWKLLARGRVRLRQRDDEAKTALTDNNEYRGRMAANCDMGTGWNTRTQLDAVRTFYLKASKGWMMSEHLSWNKRSWMVTGTLAYFHTDNYASRVYLYERLMAHDFYMPSYYGEGLHLAVLARKDIGKHLRIAARLAYTNYFDRATIGTGLQQTDGSHLTDLDVQLRWTINNKH